MADDDSDPFDRFEDAEDRDGDPFDSLDGPTEDEHESRPDESTDPGAPGPSSEEPDRTGPPGPVDPADSFDSPETADTAGGQQSDPPVDHPDSRSGGSGDDPFPGPGSTGDDPFPVPGDSGDEPVSPADREGDPFERAESAFERMDVGDLDPDSVWEQLSDAQSRGSVADIEGRTYAEVSKHPYCEQCEHFSDPPEIHCAHEGTEILEFLDVETVRVVDCPVVEERKELEGRE